VSNTRMIPGEAGFPDSGKPASINYS